MELGIYPPEADWNLEFILVVSKNLFSQSIDNAVNGIIYAFKTERNLKIHFGVALIILLLSLLLNLGRFDVILIFFAISLVLITEMINTAIEAMVNLLTLAHHPLAKIAKDVAAGSVLIASINALAVAYLVFFKKEPVFRAVLLKIKAYPYHILVLLLTIIFVLIFIIKALGRTGTFTRGGLISGHAAVAFAASTAVLCLTKNMLATLSAFLVAILVAQSRVEAKFHRWFEVVLGALIGIAASLLIFLIFHKIQM